MGNQELGGGWGDFTAEGSFDKLRAGAEDPSTGSGQAQQAQRVGGNCSDLEGRRVTLTPYQVTVQN